MKHSSVPKVSAASQLVRQKSEFTSEGAPPPGFTGQTVPPVTQDTEKSDKPRSHSGKSHTSRHEGSR